ncbi:MAG: valine--tRNA ligase [Rickettsia endosymbiont of Platyusa sonomae]|nr:valine--tRNA ligase [Rickettsia endosymbiont of Platyusa sonomae]
MTEFPKDYSFSESERKWQKFWQEQKIYLWDKNETRENSFVVDTPPPTVSGQLHIGHVYSYTQADFIVRFKRMLGKNIFYPIGFDDNGLPTERLVEKQKQIKATNMAREQFIEICKEVVISEEEKFHSLFNQMALSVDWNLEYQTINPLSQKISQMSFLDLVNKGEVYRNNQPILWDPVDQTALAQADIEDQEKTSMMNDIIFQTSKGERIIIATTRPELLPACVAVFYNPNDDRYKHLQGQFAITPLFDVKVPILADDLVQIDKGTGLVMCCTFGDVTDITWWRVHNLPMKIIIDKKGIIDLSDELSNSSSYNQINGLKIKDARSKIIEILKEKNLLVKQVEITQTVKCAERSGAPLEILTIPQWFVHTIKHKDVLMQRANEINWHPKNMKIRLENWINGLSWDWCISRQRYFGVPFPVWYSKRVGEVGKAIFPDITQLPVDPTKDLPIGYSREEVEPDYDVMDTWATSAISPQLSSYGISEKFNVDAERHHKLFPADLRPQAHEIIRTWAFYTILKAQLHENTLPWKNIMISGWCLAFDRSKMSKSKGNIIVPQKLLEQYGADVMRYWTSKSRLGADTVYSEEVMKNGKRLVNKLWNACKFAAIHFDKLDTLDKNVQIPDIESKICHKFDQWLIVKLVELVDKVESDMHNYEYTDAMELIEKFFWSVFCDNYLEITKTRAYNMDGSDNRGQYSAIITLYYSIKILLKLLAPFLPHITEEIWQILYSTKSIHSRGNWSQIKNFSFPVDQIQPDRLIKVLDLVRKAKAEKNLSVKADIKVLEIIGEKLPNDLTIDLKNVTSSHKIEFVEEFSSTNQVLKNDEVVVNIIY